MARRFLAATQLVSGYTEHQLANHQWLGEVIQVQNHTHTCYPKVWVLLNISVYVQSMFSIKVSLN